MNKSRRSFLKVAGLSACALSSGIAGLNALSGVAQAQIAPGRMIYEIEGVDEATAREAFRLAAAKLSVTTTFVTRTVR